MTQVKHLVRRQRKVKKDDNWPQRYTYQFNQKRRHGMTTPNLRPSDSVFRIYIRCLFDWCMTQVKHLVRRHRKVKKGRQPTTKNTYQIIQNRRHGTPTPNLRPSDSVFRIYIRCRFDWCMTQVKHLVRRQRKVKKGRQLTTKIHLPINQNRRHETPTVRLRPSNGIFLIYIQCRFDWCMTQVKHLVRRQRKVKKDDNWPQRYTYQFNQKRRHGMTTPNLRPSDSVFRIYIRCLFDWCMTQVKHLVRRHRKTKKSRHIHCCGDSPCGRKKHISLPLWMILVFFQPQCLPGLIPDKMLSNAFACNACMAKNGNRRMCLASWQPAKKKVVVVITELVWSVIGVFYRNLQQRRRRSFGYQ